VPVLIEEGEAEFADRRYGSTEVDKPTKYPKGKRLADIDPRWAN
jgi:hypothetical protein